MKRSKELFGKQQAALFYFLVYYFHLVSLSFKKQLSLYIFHTEIYRSVFVWFAVFLTFFTFNALFLAILNGKKEVLKLVIANIFGSLFSLIITSLLAIKYSLYGALVAISIYQSLAFFVTLFLCYKSEWFQFGYLFGKVDKGIAKKFAAFALMALVSAVLCSIVANSDS